MQREKPGPASTLPAGYPAWAEELARTYYSGSACVFVLHGNVHDLFPARDGHYVGLSDFLAGEMFGTWDAVLEHDLADGMRPQPAGNAERHKAMLSVLLPRLGDISGWPRDAERTLLWLDKFLDRCLLETEPPPPKGLAILFSYAQYLVPAADIESLSRGGGAHLVRFLSWAQNPYFKKLNIAFVLVSERLSEVNDRLIQNPHVATIEIPMPDLEARERFSASAELARMTSGLSLVDLDTLQAQAKQRGAVLGAESLRPLKKNLIERQCRGLIEFVEPKHTLDLVVGVDAAKKRLRSDAKLLLEGRLDAAPMGYLICGPVGTGKTFLAECYAGSMAIPCVKLRNFRSKYVGETEANLEQVLTVLRSLGPVVVMIDEADAALGSRQAEGDSGTSSRVFSMIASQMGDTRYRGKIIWMLLTCRPDLLPIDLKRQGRAEVHIPLFYPWNREETAAMFLAMAKKNKVPLAAEDLPPLEGTERLSGADIESVLLLARRRAFDEGDGKVDRGRLAAALRDFIPSSQGLEKELQELAAVLESTDMEFLPPHWREKVAAELGRSRIQERLAAIRQLIEM